MKPGDIVEFKRSGPTSFILGNLLWLFEHWWDKWGWHLGIAYRPDRSGGWYILEATDTGVNVNYYRVEYIEKNTRCHTWLDQIPTPEQFEKFYHDYLGKKYDVAIYFWTALQYLVRHFWNRRIPRLLDDRYTCWELVFEFCDDMGKRITSRYDCPIITDFLKA